MHRSILDNDLYSFSQQFAVLESYPHALARYDFTDRRGVYYTREFLEEFETLLDDLLKCEISEPELSWFENKFSWATPAYLDYLRNYKFDRTQVHYELAAERFNLSIVGPWHSTILWEVPLLSIISEAYFNTVDKDWTTSGQEEIIDKKSKFLNSNDLNHVEFGTRRRRNFSTQRKVLNVLSNGTAKNFVGTSNLHFARLMNLTPVGTMSHQWIMAHSSLVSIQKANRFALYNWNRIFNGQLGIALTDTYGLDSFLNDFDSNLARIYDGSRHDSGDAIQFATKMKRHYDKLDIDWRSKKFLYSDGLDVTNTNIIRDSAHAEVNNCVFCIGTHFTNDFVRRNGSASQALNIVIKLTQINGRPVAKLSDSPGKASGDADAIRVARYFHMGLPLDSKR